MHDVIVIGGGPAGSTAATLLVRKGFSVLLLERERFPRFQIGESLLPFNNDLFNRLGVAEQLSQGQFQPKYGASFVTGDGRVGYDFCFERTLPPEYHRSFQVKRALFDDLLLRNAKATGVEVREETAVTAVDVGQPGKAFVETAGGERHEAKFVVDASGHGSIVGNRVGQKADVATLKKIAIFAHFKGVSKRPGREGGNTVIVVLRNAWFWLIPVTEDIMSVGLVVDRDHFLKSGLSTEDILHETIAKTPWMRSRMSEAERVTQVYARKDFSYLMKNVAGENFALVGDAAGFLDPIFSTGVYLAMMSADMAADAIEAKLRRGSMRGLRRYERDITRALARYHRFIENFYRREFLEVFLQPSDRFGLLDVIIGVLAGDVFTSRRNRLRLALFFLLVRIQKARPVIARPIAWEALPQVASV
ncbi:MAG: NAD(P)/FAD-dependent oxidoreductase [Thermoanaerobaculia bacterium]